MPDPATQRPAICLNMIVRNEAHVVQETLDSVAPHISSWVIVDTGSHDGTQDFIRNYMGHLGIPGKLYERPWRNFGVNRSEALTLAQGHGNYILVMDADDMLVGTPDFDDLDADIYSIRIGQGSFTYWRPQLFRDGLPLRYEGVVHEYITGEASYRQRRLDGEYHVESRRLGTRSRDPQKYARDRDLLLAEVERSPDNGRWVFYLAQSYFDLDDFDNARKWYSRRIELGGWDEEVYYSMCRVAESMQRLGAPWPDVQHAYLKAWEFRPRRAEALHAIARQYRVDRRYRLGYLFAKQAAEIPLPEQDILLVGADVYAWRASDEQAVCASWIGKHSEALTLCRRALARPDLPDHERSRIAGNRDFSVPAMIDAASPYPDALVRNLVNSTGDSEVTVSMVGGPDRKTVELTLNSFLHCCTDVAQAERFLVFDAGLSTHDRAALQERYGFLEFSQYGYDDGVLARIGEVRAQIGTQFWLHLGRGWRFFAQEDFITRLSAVLKAETRVFQVGINFGDAVQLTGACAREQAVRRTPEAGRYVLTDAPATGPAMFETERLDRSGGLQTASLDEVLCVSAESEA